MKATELPVPGILWGDYPERRSASAAHGAGAVPAALRVAMDRLHARLSSSTTRLLGAFEKQRHAYRGLDATGFAEAVRQVRLGLQRAGLIDAQIAEALALVAVAFERQLGLRIYETQVIAARLVLANHLAEMATGEGKTYAVALAAATAALAGIPVHVVTANDYLVGRDADSLRPLYAALGLRVGAALQGQPDAERRAAYACDITYCTAKELVFDYLRDGLGRSRDLLQQRASKLAGEDGPAPLLRGLCMAIVDEADSILIDEARVPFILARAADNGQETRYLGQSPSKSPVALKAGATSASTPPGSRSVSPHRERSASKRWSPAARRSGAIACIARKPSARRWPRCIITGATATTWCAMARS